MILLIWLHKILHFKHLEMIKEIFVRVVGKQHRQSFKKSENRAKNTCELLHADLSDPMQETSLGGSRYMIILGDVLFSKYRYIYCLRSKAEACTTLERFLPEVKADLKMSVGFIRTDNGLEFVNKEIKQLFLKNSIIHQTSV